MVLPTMGPEITTSPLMMPHVHSSSSSHSVPTLSLDNHRNSQSSFLSGYSSDSDVELVVEEGLRHTSGKLSAKRYKTKVFADQVLRIILSLRVPTWSSTLGPEGPLSADNVKITKVSGSLTNAVFFVSYPSNPRMKTLLLRIYGASSGALISRSRELHTLHILSSQYKIGPRVYGTFDNGRIEEYFRSTTLTSAQMRDPTISRWIGARMAELHSVDIDIIEEDKGWDIAARKNVQAWIQPARDVLKLASVPDSFKANLDFDRFVREWTAYMNWLAKWEDKNGASRRVFAHNDAQYGNLLRLDDVKEGTPDHRQIIVVDFEYAAPNAAAFDIANHFHEWTANYHGPTPHLLDPSRYPTEEERRNFYDSYIAHSTTAASSSDSSLLATGRSQPAADKDAEMAQLDAQVRVWSPASHAMWAVWGIVQAREDLEQAAQAHAIGSVPDEPEFDYLGYALCRVEGFRREIRALGIEA